MNGGRRAPRAADSGFDFTSPALMSGADIDPDDDAGTAGQTEDAALGSGHGLV